MLEYITLALFILIITYGCYRKMEKRNCSKDSLPRGKKKAVFITGCDTGFGYSLILHNLKRCDITNVQVWIAGCYYPGGSSEGADSLKQYAKDIGKEDALHIVHLDVTKDESVNDAKDEINRILDETDSMLWSVVNNAASLVFADAAFQTSEQVRNQIDVNFYGVWSISKNFTPHLISSKGRIVNIISFCTECPLPTLSLYTATKAAVLSLSEGMRMECAKLGVDVVLFNPGDHPKGTPLCSGQDNNYKAMEKEVNEAYKDNSTVLDYFQGCKDKFVTNFPRPPLKKIDSPGLYTEFEKIITDYKPRYAYVNSDLITRSFFGVLRVLPRKWSDVARLAIMRLPK